MQSILLQPKIASTLLTPFNIHVRYAIVNKSSLHSRFAASRRRRLYWQDELLETTHLLSMVSDALLAIKLVDPCHIPDVVNWYKDYPYTDNSEPHSFGEETSANHEQGVVHAG